MRADEKPSALGTTQPSNLKPSVLGTETQPSLRAKGKPRALGTETQLTPRVAGKATTDVLGSKSAVISACGTYRYLLTRHTEGPGRGFGKHFRVVFVLLNPSTADATKDDPTVRRCVGFARRFGAERLDIVNVFGLRATDPKELRGHPDPVGPLNDRFVREAAEEANLVIVGWGAMRPILKDRLPLLALFGVEVHCLGTTRTGSPKHPLYLPAGAPLLVWKGMP